MGSPAPAANETPSGSGRTCCSSTATTSWNAPMPANAATGSPGRSAEPSGASRTDPASSEPIVNGRSGWYW